MNTEDLKKAERTLKRLLTNIPIEDDTRDITREIKYTLEKVENVLFKNKLLDLGYRIEHYALPEKRNWRVLSAGYNTETHICYWGDQSSLTWPDPGYTQPVPGRYYVNVQFSTGPYILCVGNDRGYEVAKPFFNEMVQEYLDLKPDYVDSHNNHYLWKIENPNAAKAFNLGVDNIIGKYQEKFQKFLNEDKAARIMELQNQIDKIKSE